MYKLWHKAIVLLMVVGFLVGCASNKGTSTQKGAVIGTAAGAAIGAAVGNQSGEKGKGAAIGAGVGAVTGGLIGNQLEGRGEQREGSEGERREPEERSSQRDRR